MSFLRSLEDVAKGAAIGVATVTALPIFGAIGTITSTGIVVGSVVGAAAAVIDTINNGNQ
jgi:hypothetical protein